MADQIPLVISIIEDPNGQSPTLLSIGYGTGYTVIQFESRKDIDKLLEFISRNKTVTGARYEGIRSLDVIGYFSSCPVSFCLSKDDFSFHIDSGRVVDGFSQSAGLYIPIALLEKFYAALETAKEKSTGRALDSYPKNNDL